MAGFDGFGYPVTLRTTARSRQLTGVAGLTGTGGRIDRNRWPECSGLGGRNGPESVAGLDRNGWPDYAGIRN